MNKSIKISLNYFLGPLLFVILCYVLYIQVRNQPELGTRWQEIKQSWQSPYLWLSLALMPLNWGIESVKWKYLLSHLEKVSFLRALKSVFAGCSITLLTPNRIGEYGGRILYLKNENRLRGISLTILGSMSQLLITILIGFGGLTFLQYSGQNSHNISEILPGKSLQLLWIITLATLVVMVLLFFNEGFIARWIFRIPGAKKLEVFSNLLSSYSGKELLTLTAMSAVRYIVFVLQFWLMLKAMQVHIGLWLSVVLLSVFYLLLAMAPSIGFTELPLRAIAGVQVLGIATQNKLGVEAASLGIWLTNIFIPAIVGTILISGVRIINKKNEVI